MSSSTAQNDPLDGRVLPPSGLLARFNHYRKRYGFMHAILSYAGRHSFPFWKCVGPWITKKYLRNWLAAPGPHIVNLGGGSVLHERWLTADVDPRSDVWSDVTAPLAFPDHSTDVVYLEEVIEHVTKQEGEALLREVLRILRPKGYLRITTPSLDYFIKAAQSSLVDTTPINEIFYLHGHRHIYSELELQNMLQRVGYEHVESSSYRDPNSKFGHFDTHPLRFEFAPHECSQYWEARKPQDA